jgi:hypothetical protein
MPPSKLHCLPSSVRVLNMFSSKYAVLGDCKLCACGVAGNL